MYEICGQVDGLWLLCSSSLIDTPFRTYSFRVTFTAFFSACLIAFGQEQEQLLKDAQRYYTENHYLKAIEILENLWQQNKQPTQVAYCLGPALYSLHKEKAF